MDMIPPIPKRTSRPSPPARGPLQHKFIVPDPWNLAYGKRVPLEIGPKIISVSFPNLPKGFGMVTLGFWFSTGDRAVIWPEGLESEAMLLVGPDGEADLPVGPYKRWLVDLPEGTSVEISLDNVGQPDR